MKPLLLLLAITAPAFARLGETPAECQKRYGAIREKSEDGSGVKFEGKGLVRVDCWFQEGKCSAVMYRLADPGMTEHADYTVRFNEEHRALLLLANQGPSKFIPWEKPDRSSFSEGETMKTEDGSRVAVISKGYVMIETTESIEKRKSMLSPAAIKAAIQGF